MKTFWTFLNEVSKGDLAKVGERINRFIKKETEPFHDLFGGSSRVVIPILDDTQKKFMAFLSELGVFNIDLKKGTAFMKVETQQGSRNREVKINKFIQDSVKRNKAGAEGVEWMKWYEKTKEKFANPSQGVSIVISRHPIDILRMSDQGEWTSCHSPDGSYYQCAVQEARTGGAVAYIVRNSDLQKVKDLNAKEIFQDPDRDVKGIRALERIRLRRFTDEGENDILVPEVRTYGTKHVGFYDSVKAWALHNQKDTLKNVNFKDLKLKGGSYQDNTAGQIWSQFTDTPTTGSKKSLDQDEEASKQHGDLPERVDELIAGHHYTHFSVSGNAEDGSVSYDGSVYFEFPAKSLKKPLPGWDDDGYRELKKEVEDALNECDIYGVEEVNIEMNKDHRTNEEIGEIRVYFRDNDGNYDLDGLEHFLDNVDDMDKNFPKTYRAVEHVLITHGYMDNHLESVEFKHFEYEQSSDRDGVTHEFMSKSPVQIGSLDGLYSVGMLYNGRNNFGWLEDEGRQGLKTASSEFTKALKDVIADVVEVDISGYVEVSAAVEMEADLPAESASNTDEIDYADGVIKNNPLLLKMTVSHLHGDDPKPTDFTLTSQAVARLDKAYGEIVKGMIHWWGEKKAKLIELQSDVQNSPGFKRLAGGGLNHPDRRLGKGGSSGVTPKKDQKGLRFWYEDKAAGVSMAYSRFKSYVRQLLMAAAGRYQKRMGEDASRELVLRFAQGKPHIFYKKGRYGQEVEEKLNDFIGYKNGMTPAQAHELGEKYVGKVVKYVNQDAYAIVNYVQGDEESMPKLNLYNIDHQNGGMDRSWTNVWSVQEVGDIPQAVKNALKKIMDRHSRFFEDMPEVVKFANQGK